MSLPGVIKMSGQLSFCGFHRLLDVLKRIIQNSCFLWMTDLTRGVKSFCSRVVNYDLAPRLERLFSCLMTQWCHTIWFYRVCRYLMLGPFSNLRVPNVSPWQQLKGFMSMRWLNFVSEEQSGGRYSCRLRPHKLSWPLHLRDRSVLMRKTSLF